MKILVDAHERFVTCLRWAPEIVKNSPAAYYGAVEEQNHEKNGTLKSKGNEAGTSDVQIRCIIATGGVDQKLKIFAN